MTTPGATILVVDDDPDAIEIVRTYLEAKGYRVTSAMDGREALAKLEEVHPALVLLDVMMPEMDGWEVARTIKNHPAYADVRVVMLTARSDFTDKQEGLRSGADDYIVKPIRLDELGKKVERNLEARGRTA
jgi:two-component system alkaline phosphatase synthesis response regulator PhoP